MLLADEGATLLEEDKTDEAIAKWTQALTLAPDNCEILYYRGTAYTNQNKKEEACKDYNRIKELIGVTWFEDIRRLVCGF
jgi:tetratricopeptide (TPR) repeat protein